jgi:hypothetical protein
VAPDDDGSVATTAAVDEEGDEEVDMYALPRKQRILKTVQSSTHFSGEEQKIVKSAHFNLCCTFHAVLDFVERIQDQRDKFSTK